MSGPDLVGIFTVLRSSRPRDGDLVSHTTGLKLAAGEVLAAVDSRGWRHLVIPLLPGEAARTWSRGRVRLGRLDVSGTPHLSIHCTDPALDAVFNRFAQELVRDLSDAPSPALAAAQAFQAWRSMFDGDTRAGSSIETIIGLIGELQTVLDALEAGANPDLAWWCGPDGAVHDLRAGGHAIEVKTSQVREGRFAVIHGIEQLAIPADGTLHLQVHSLERDPGGANLGTMMERVVTAGADGAVLASNLTALGVATADTDAASALRFSCRESLLYDVGQPQFPRITADSFATGAMPAGTLRLSYAVDLTNVPPAPMGNHEASAAMRRFAAETGSAR